MEALFGLERYDGVISVVIEAEMGDPNAADMDDIKKRTPSGFALKSLTLRMRRGSGTGAATDDSASAGEPGPAASASWGAPNTDDLKQLTGILVLRRAQSYNAVYRISREDVCQFKCAQDFGSLFQAPDQKPVEVNALLKACKALITDDAETACALLHQVCCECLRACVFSGCISCVSDRRPH